MDRTGLGMTITRKAGCAEITAPLSIWQAAGHFMNTDGAAETLVPFRVFPGELKRTVLALRATSH
jgi:hypothetical protein